MCLEVGTKIKIIETKCGCYSAQGKTGVVTRKKSNNGLLESDLGFNVDVGNGSIWRINEDAKVEILEKPYCFDYSLLEDGVIVECRNGERALVLGEQVVFDNGFLRLRDFDFDLRHENNPQFDIIKIYHAKITYSIRALFSNDCLALIAERKEARKMTVREICNELGYDVEIIKEEK